jgi:hypothetical protein
MKTLPDTRSKNLFKCLEARGLQHLRHLRNGHGAEKETLARACRVTFATICLRSSAGRRSFNQPPSKRASTGIDPQISMTSVRIHHGFRMA